MIWREILNSRARPALRAAPAAARVVVFAAVAGLAVIVAATPALAAQHPGGTAASHARAGATGRHTAAGRMSPGPRWAHVAAGSIHTCGIRTGGTCGAGATTNTASSAPVPTPARTGPSRSPPPRGEGGPASPPATTTRAPSAPAAPCGAGATTPTASSAPATTPARTSPSRSPPRQREDGPPSPPGTSTPAPPAPTPPCGAGAYNGNGELGTGNHTSQDQPRQVTTPAARGWAGVTTGSADSCGIRAGGTLWCWGDNTYGELGTSNHTSQDRPRQVTTPAAGGWASITAGYGHICATRTNSTLWCWGFDDFGQLGTGTGSNQDRPRQVITPAPGEWASVTAGDTHTCATRTGGTLWCWGSNYEGELGIGTTSLQEPPRQVTTPAPGGWASITAGFLHTCAIRTNGTLWCWGDNGNGQLGIGNHTEPDQPQQVTGCAQQGASFPARPSRSISRQQPGPHPAKHGRRA